MSCVHWQVLLILAAGSGAGAFRCDPGGLCRAHDTAAAAADDDGHGGDPDTSPDNSSWPTLLSESPAECKRKVAVLQKLGIPGTLKCLGAGGVCLGSLEAWNDGCPFDAKALGKAASHTSQFGCAQIEEEDDGVPEAGSSSAASVLLARRGLSMSLLTLEDCNATVKWLNGLVPPPPAPPPAPAPPQQCRCHNDSWSTWQCVPLATGEAPTGLNRSGCEVGCRHPFCSPENATCSLLAYNAPVPDQKFYNMSSCALGCSTFKCNAFSDRCEAVPPAERCNRTATIPCGGVFYSLASCQTGCGGGPVTPDGMLSTPGPFPCESLFKFKRVHVDPLAIHNDPDSAKPCPSHVICV